MTRGYPKTDARMADGLAKGQVPYPNMPMMFVAATIHQP
jgi:hypothetical protein